MDDVDRRTNEINKSGGFSFLRKSLSFISIDSWLNAASSLLLPSATRSSLLSSVVRSLLLPSKKYSPLSSSLNVVSWSEEQQCKRSKSNICKDWANGNYCRYGDYQCSNLHSWCDGVKEEFHEGNPKSTRVAWWTPPPENFVKINCDGALSHQQGKAAAGGVVRDSNGRFVTGFSSVLPSCDSVLESELLAIKIGMETAMSRGFKNLVVESDSKLAIELIRNAQEHSNNHHPYAPLASSIRQIGNKADRVCWNHVFRETNSVADGFAKHGLSLPPRFCVKHFESPPHFISTPMCADQAGSTYTR